MGKQFKTIFSETGQSSLPLSQYVEITPVLSTTLARSQTGVKPLFSLPASLPGTGLAGGELAPSECVPGRVALTELDTLKTPQPVRSQPGIISSQGGYGQPGGVPSVQRALDRDGFAPRENLNASFSMAGGPGIPSARIDIMAGSFSRPSAAGWNKQFPATVNPPVPDSLPRSRVRQKKRKGRRAALVSVLLTFSVCLLFLAGGGYWFYQHSQQSAPTVRATQMAVAPTATTPPVTPTPSPTPQPTATAVPALSPVPASVSGVSYLIMVSLSQQKMTAYDHGKPVLTTLVTTGKPTLYTPPGTYYISQRVANSWFTSPWPKSSPNYYPPIYVYYGLRLNSTQLYLHDATWRSLFGPDVAPAQRSHGCVETPLTAMKWLYSWAPLETMVVVVW